MNPMTEPHPSAAAFRAARDLLLRHHDDYAAAKREFSWPALEEFNWALDWFDVIAAEHPGRTALRIVADGDAAAQLSYGELASRHNRLFGRRWFGGKSPEPLGDPSFSSLADLTTGYGSISRMRPLPIGRLSLVLLLVVCLAPAVPALLAGVPLNDMLVQVVKTVLL